MFGIGEGITAMANYFGAERQHDLNMQGAERAEFASAHQAALSRDWQERMSNTGYERATASMKNAGLNPMLAYHQGPAPTPGGATGSGFPSQSSKVESIPISTAAQIRNLDASTAKQQAEADEIKARTPTHGQSIEESKARISNIGQQIGESAMRIEKIIAETTQADASAANIRQQTLNLKTTIPHIQESIRLLRAQTTQTGTITKEANQRIVQNLPHLEAQIKKLDIIYKAMEAPGRETTHAFEQSGAGAVLRSIREALKSLIPFLP